MALFVILLMLCVWWTWEEGLVFVIRFRGSRGRLAIAGGVALPTESNLCNRMV